LKNLSTTSETKLWDGLSIHSKGKLGGLYI